MRALCCVEPGKLELIDVPRPDRPAGWARVAIAHVGICGTDYHIFEGTHPFLAYPRVALLRQNALLIGIGYGLFVWTMMNLVLVPLTRIKPGPFNLNNAAIQASILVVCIGLPISLLARRHYAKA